VRRRFTRQKKNLKSENFSCLFRSWFFGSLTLLAFLGALSLSSLFLQNVEARIKVQNVITSILGVEISNLNEPPDDKERVEVEHELDVAIESFFKNIIKQFISSWYSAITQDESFVWNIKVELTAAIREIARRLRNVIGVNWKFMSEKITRDLPFSRSITQN
jgi:PXA domain